MSRGSGAELNGRAAEEIAERLYLSEGATVLARRWRCPEGEIDLVLQLPETIVFVEVKARRDRDRAAEAITPAQWRRLRAAAERFLAETAPPGSDCRFDVVAIDRGGRVGRIVDAARFDDW